MLEMKPAAFADESHLSNEKKREVEDDDNVLAWDSMENGASVTGDRIAGGDLGVGKQSGA